ncbi:MULTISPECIES: hypothetical protein [unclassified Acinetobacter]|uniref:hypothetical protein n=1 Tax=unclassified Acinetobacter TaxID=196816 RepID=UPI0025C60561|nr:MULTISPECIES: hypothetical protein [unclassified Acinetobacter]
MSNEEFEQAKAEAKVLARKVHDAARIIAMDGRPINKNWIEEGSYVDMNEATKKWEKCTINLKVKDARSYNEWIDITLDDGTVILDTDYYISGSGNSEFEVKTFRNGAWAERFISYSTEGVQAELEKQKKVELQERLKPFSEIDF